MRLAGFMKSERGAVTTDWVIMATATLGLGLATMSVISRGTDDLSGDIDTFLADTDVQASAAFAPFAPMVLAAFDFAQGEAAGWVGGWPVNVGGALGDVLQIGAKETASLSVNVPDGADTVTLSFDLIGMDSIDREPATIYVNGSPVLMGRGDFGEITFTDLSGENIGIGLVDLAREEELGGNTRPGWTESVTSITLTVANPDDQVTLSVYSDTNQGRNDESYALDNVVVEAS